MLFNERGHKIVATTANHGYGNKGRKRKQWLLKNFGAANSGRSIDMSSAEGKKMASELAERYPEMNIKGPFE
ncbi:MAG: hypothetical protein ACLFR0_03415 [Alphaproteobacteria bacterium]